MKRFQFRLIWIFVATLLAAELCCKYNFAKTEIAKIDSNHYRVSISVLIPFIIDVNMADDLTCVKRRYAGAVGFYYLIDESGRIYH